MNPVVRFALLLLVLTNLAFVSITKVVDLEWLVVFFALTGSAMSLSLFCDRMWFRALWNGGLFVIFAVLVNDATRSGVTYMLEDGLILATFCQIHLLNNLGRRQRPDLLFFNSFLIALVTCFFSSDLAYLLVFVPWVFFQLMAMQIATLARDDDRMSWRSWRMLLGASLRRTLLTLGATGLCFVVVPRDFSREGFAARFLQRNDVAEVGFADEVRLGASSAARSDRTVLRIERRSGSMPLARYLRGATMTRLVGNRWVSDDVTVRRHLGGQWMRVQNEFRRTPPGEASTTYAIRILDQGLHRLLLPYGTQVLRPGAGLTMNDLDVHGDFTASLLKSLLRSAEPEYLVVVGSDARASQRQRSDQPFRDKLRPYLSIGNALLQARAKRLADELARALPAERRATTKQLAEGMAEALSERQPYALPGESGAAKSLEDFIDGAAGHCEYFASALILALRAKGIPCRMVTGFLISNGEATQIAVQARDAHAWVEVFDVEHGWFHVDATPSAFESSAQNSGTWFGSLGAKLTDFWHAVTAMSAADRQAALAALWDRGLALLTLPLREPLLCLMGALLAAMLIVALRRRRKAKTSVAIRDYERAIRRSGLRRLEAESPREFLSRAETTAIDASKLSELRAATVEHERLRYAGEGSCST